MTSALELLQASSRRMADYKRAAPARAKAAGDDLHDAIAAFNAGHDLLALVQPHTKIKRTGATHGGEHHGPCPLCGGTDRFMLWPREGSAWCRRCQRHGDALRWAIYLDGHNPDTAGETARYLQERGFLAARHAATPPAPRFTPSMHVAPMPPALAGASAPRRLDASTPVPVFVLNALGSNPDALEEWVERAGIMEYDGGLPREEAERAALHILTSRTVTGAMQ